MATSVRKLGESERERRWEVNLSLSTRTALASALARDSLIHNSLSLARADRFQAGMSPLSIISLWFQYLIIHHTELVPPNAEYNPSTVNIRSGRQHVHVVSVFFLKSYFRSLCPTFVPYVLWTVGRNGLHFPNQIYFLKYP